MKRAFGSILYELRKKANLTQVDLAKKSGLSQSEISRLESGYRWPVLRTLRALGKALETDLGKLIKMTGDEFDKPDAQRWRSLNDDEEVG